MRSKNDLDVIVIGGSYAGLAAAMALGRALKKVLVVDEGNACNRQTPHSHNFLTNDGKTPAAITKIAHQQVQQYETIRFLRGRVTAGNTIDNGYAIQLTTGATFRATKLIFATGIKDLLSSIKGLAACWGISVIHCPFCHGYEVRNEVTGVLGNGDNAFDFARLISNWTKDLTIFTNGISTITTAQTTALARHNIHIVEKEIVRLEHTDGHLEKIIFIDGTQFLIKAMYAPAPFEQHCKLPESLGCEMTEEGYIKVNGLQETTVKGVYACGDNSTKMRTVANAVATGTTAGIAVSKQIIAEEF